MKYLFVAVAVGSVAWLASCNLIDRRHDRKMRIEPGAIYFDYRVWGDEDNGFMTVRLQYKLGGPNGETVAWEEPAKVELDGEALKVDSTKMNGKYYEKIIPIDDFIGKHTISFTDENNNEYEEEFNFQPVELVTAIPRVVDRDSMEFDFTGLDKEDFIRVMMTDTTAFGEGVVRVDTVNDGKLSIGRRAIAVLTDGPIHLRLSREKDYEIKDGTPAGGKLTISYGLRRDFVLRDSVAAESR